MPEFSWTVYTVVPNGPTYDVRAVTWTTQGPEDTHEASRVAGGMTQPEALEYAARQQRNYDSIRNMIAPR